MTSRRFSRCLCSVAGSAVLIAAGLMVVFTWPFLYVYVIDGIMKLSPDADAYKIWRKFPEFMPIDFYFFNWTNPHDVNNDSAKLRFQQMGPYRFLETKEKSDIVWNDNGTVSYRHLKHWYYDGSTERDVQDNITTINPVAVAAVHTSRNWNFLIRKALSLSYSNLISHVHLTRTVSQMLFEGYSDPLINIARSLPMLAGVPLPPWDKFGWFYSRNGSTEFEGIFNMGTGNKHTNFGRLYAWNYWTQTPYFEGKCGGINGSAGELFGTGPGKTSITIFSPDLCRTMTLNFNSEVVVKNMLGYKYVVDSYTLDNGTVYPENKCYCNGECVPSGLLNVSSCRYGSPSFASLPHFYQADPYYRNLLEGMHPDKNKHEFYIVLEPITGIPLEVKARLQINLLMQPVPGVTLYEKVPRVFVPMLWFEQRVQIPDNEAFKLKLLLSMPVICSSLGILVAFMGFIVISCIVYKICTKKLCMLRKEQQFYVESMPLKNDQHVEMILKP